MKYLKVFTDFAVCLEPYSDAEIGRLFIAMMKYAETGEQPDFRGNERMIWPTAKLNIDREIEYIEKQAQNGRKGGRPKKPNETQLNPVKPSKTQKSQKDKDKEKNNTPPNPPWGEWDDVSPELRNALEDYETMRKKIRKPLTDTAKKMVLPKLRELSKDENYQIAVLKQSVFNSWQGLFPLKEQAEQPEPPKPRKLERMW